MSDIAITTTLRRTDLFWMNQDSWPARGCFVAGALFLAAAPGAPDPGTVALCALVAIGFSLVAGPIYLMWLTRSFALVWRTVHLRFDDQGLRGWPNGDDDDRTWDRVRRVWTRPGVIIIQFGWFVGSRGGRIVIPTRDVGPKQHEALWSLLAARGLVRADRRSVRRRFMDSLSDWWSS